MSNLNVFLNPAPVENETVIISKRFLDEHGKPVPFIIRPITQKENDLLIRQSTRTIKVNGHPVEKLDNVEYSRRVVIAATVTPDFTREELCRAYDTMDPLEVPGKMLLVGEYNKLSAAIMALSGLEVDLEEQAQN